MRRLKALRISAELMASFLAAPVPPGLVQQGFPADARVVGCDWREPRTIVLIIEHDSFEPVKEGEYPPDLVLTVTKLYTPDAAPVQ